MTDFRIVSNAALNGLRFADKAIDTNVVDDVVKASVTIEQGVINPLALVPGMNMLPIGQGSLLHRATTLVRQPASGGGAGSFDDAVRALHNLGSRHQVEGILLRENPGHYGGIMFKGDVGYVSGQPVIDRIGRDAAFRIDRAARLVQDFVDARA